MRINFGFSRFEILIMMIIYKFLLFPFYYFFPPKNPPIFPKMPVGFVSSFFFSIL